MPPTIRSGPADQTPPEPAVAASIGKEMAAIRESAAELKEKTDKLVTNEMLAASILHIGEQIALVLAEVAKTQAAHASLSDRIPHLVARLHERANEQLLRDLEVLRLADREAFTKEIVELLATERQDRTNAINAMATELRAEFSGRFDALDDKVNHFDLNVGKALKERDSRGEELAAEVAREAEEAEQEISKLHDKAKLLEAATKATAEKAKATEERAKKTEEQVAIFTRGRVGFGLGSAALALAAKSDATWASVKLWLWSHGLLVTVAVLVAVVALVVEIHARLRARKGPPTP